MQKVMLPPAFLGALVFRDTTPCMEYGLGIRVLGIWVWGAGIESTGNSLEDEIASGVNSVL